MRRKLGEPAGAGWALLGVPVPAGLLLGFGAGLWWGAFALQVSACAGYIAGKYMRRADQQDRHTAV